MSNLFRRIILRRSPTSVFAHGFSQSPLKSLRYLSTSSEIVSSPKYSSLASNAVKLKNKQAVTALLENHGFSESQISDLAKRSPQIFSAKPEKTLLPKLLFFQSKGFSSPEIVKLICSVPSVLKASLDNRIIPAFDYIQAVLGTKEKTLAAIKHFAGILLAVRTVMSNLFRRIILLRSPSSVFTHGFSKSPLIYLRYLSTSSEIVSSPNSASLASNVAQLENNQKAIAFLANHGFSESQISDLAKRLPQIFSGNPEKILLPKLLFFQSKGLSSPDIVKSVCAVPNVLKRSLNKQIIPVFDYITAVVGTEEKTVAVIKSHAGILTWNLRKFLPNIEILKQFGVPDSNILTILHQQPRMFMTIPIRFKEIVERVTEMGFDPQRLQFVVAVNALRSMSKSTWDKKVEVFRKWGLSEKEICLAFRRYPWCMMASEDKINGAMDFFVNKIGCELSFVARRPSLLALSLKKRILPRGYVYQVLLSKGLIKKHMSINLFFECPENRFIEKFINPHKEQIPGLLELYEQRLLDSRR